MAGDAGVCPELEQECDELQMFPARCDMLFQGIKFHGLLQLCEWGRSAEGPTYQRRLAVLVLLIHARGGASVNQHGNDVHEPPCRGVMLHRRPEHILSAAADPCSSLHLGRQTFSAALLQFRPSWTKHSGTVMETHQRCASVLVCGHGTGSRLQQEPRTFGVA